MDLYLNDLYSTLDLTHVSDSSLFIVGNFSFSRTRAWCG